MVHDCQLDYYGKKLATCSSDGTVKVFAVDQKTNQHQLNTTITTHTAPVWQVKWAHPRFGVLLASCSYDRKVLIHLESQPGIWKPIFTFNHESSVNGIDFASNEYGLILLSASSDGRVCLHEHKPDDSWDTKETVVSKLGVNSVSIAPYGLFHGGMTFATGANDGTVRIYFHKANSSGTTTGDSTMTDPVTGAPIVGGTSHQQMSNPIEELKTLAMHDDWVRDVAFSPNTSRPTLASAGQDKKVFIWTLDRASGEWKSQLLNEFPHPVWNVNWSLTGDILAVASGDDSVTLWKERMDHTWIQVGNVTE